MRLRDVANAFFIFSLYLLNSFKTYLRIISPNAIKYLLKAGVTYKTQFRKNSLSIQDRAIYIITIYLLKDFAVPR
jgi:hypothetical protein